jgi:hypothetical protein
MARLCKGNGLILAGLIVTLVGQGVALAATLDIPRYWATTGVGLALLAAGVARRALRPPDGS